MSASVFDMEFVVPNDEMLAVELGKTKKYLDSICSFIKSDYRDLTPEWKYYGKKSGWVLKLFNKKRNVLFIVPCSKHFRAVFTFGDKAVDKVLASILPDSIKHELFVAKKFSEGRTIQVEVKTEADLENIIQLIKIKLDS